MGKLKYLAVAASRLMAASKKMAVFI